MPTVFIGVGSNLGDRSAYLEGAKEVLLGNPEIANFRTSSVYETQPVEASGGKYLNAVWSFDTNLDPRSTLGMLHAIEKKAGRVRHERNEPRVLDLDLLIYGDAVLDTRELILPHPRMAEREFVLRPFCELAPEWIHPLLGKSARELLCSLERKL